MGGESSFFIFFRFFVFFSSLLAHFLFPFSHFPDSHFHRTPTSSSTTSSTTASRPCRRRPGRGQRRRRRRQQPEEERRRRRRRRRRGGASSGAEELPPPPQPQQRQQLPSPPPPRPPKQQRRLPLPPPRAAGLRAPREPPGPGPTAAAGAGGRGGGSPPPSEPAATWIDDVFRGTLVSETRCLACEACSQRSEPFYDLSLEVAPDSSLTGCLRTFSKVETLGGEDKLRCESCGVLQEAQKRLRVLALPRVLCLHLKRFKYAGAEGGGGGGNGYYGAAPRMRKLGHRVAFPRELRLGPVVASAGCPDADATLRLSAVVVHVGLGRATGTTWRS